MNQPLIKALRTIRPAVKWTAHLPSPSLVKGLRRLRETQAAAHQLPLFVELKKSRRKEDPELAKLRQEVYMLPMWTVRLVREGQHEVDGVLIKSPADAANIFRPIMKDRDREMMVTLFLNTRGKAIGINVAMIGSASQITINIADLFRPAIMAGAQTMIVAHNHPSGDPSPSPEDVKVTEMLVESGKLLDVPVLDHLVIGAGERFVSLKERGLGFK